jgi:hypothetical protein
MPEIPEMADRPGMQIFLAREVTCEATLEIPSKLIKL